MKLIKIIFGALLIVAALSQLVRTVMAYAVTQSAAPTDFSQLMGGVVGTCIFLALGAWLIKSGKEKK